MPRACAYDVLGGAIEDALCCCVKCEVSYVWRSERVARRLLLWSLSSCSIEMEPSMASACMVFFGTAFFLFDRSDVHDNSAATFFAHAPYMQHAGNTNARAQCTEISIPKRDGHTYIHTYRRKTRCEAGLAALR